jgi:hypothetical protein
MNNNNNIIITYKPEEGPERMWSREASAPHRMDRAAGGVAVSTKAQSRVELESVSSLSLRVCVT